MVGLRALGHNNLNEYYSVHKILDHPGLLRLTSDIKNVSLKSLLLQLLSDNVQFRGEAMNFVKFG
jgi:hypothetical protein